MKINKLRKFWASMAIIFMMSQVFIPSGTALAEVLNEEQSNTVQVGKENSSKEESDDSKNELNTEKKDPEGSIENENGAEKEKETTVGESQNGNDSPTVVPELTVPSLEELVKAVEAPSLNVLTFGEDGSPRLNGETFYKTEDQITNENLVELMKKGEANGGYAKMERAGVNIEYLGQVSNGVSTVGNFKVNGQQAYCVEHSKPTPPTGTPNNGDVPYANDDIKKTLYFGWDGTENIFTDFSEGVTATSLVLSYFYTGIVSGLNEPGPQALLNKVANSEVPNEIASFSTTNPSVYIENKIQRTENIKLNGDSRNKFTFNVPAGMTFNNVSNGEVATNANITVKGGETFFLSANLAYTNNYSTGNLSGSMKKYQTILTMMVDSNLQTLGRGGWTDPGFTIKFDAKFYARLGNVIVNKKDAETGTTPQGDGTLNGAVYRVTDSAGTSKDVTIANNTAMAKDLQVGEVKIQEITPPTGYQLDPTIYTAQLDYNSSTGKVEVTREVKENVIKGNVDIMKYFELIPGGGMLTPERGAEFTITLKSSGKEYGRETTDEKGHAAFLNLPYGDYRVHQTKALPGLIKVEDFDVTVDEHGKTYYYNILNQNFMSPLKLIKADEDTGKNVLVEGTVFKIKSVETGEWLSQTTHNITEFVTNADGEVLLFDKVKHGDYLLYEIKAPDGYVQNKEPMPFSVTEENQEAGLITVTFKNKAQVGKVTLTKTGEAMTDAETNQTDYGTQYTPVFTQKPLEGSEFVFEALEDIFTNDGTLRYAKGDKVDEGISNDLGEISTNPETNPFYPGKYVAIETKAPIGFTTAEPMPFEVLYEGQEVEISSTSVQVENELQELLIKIYKTEGSVVTWENGQPVIEQVPSDGKVFGIFAREGFSFNEKELIPSSGLMALATTKEGVAEVQAKFSQGKFFVREVDAGENHVINETEYDFEFTAQNNAPIFEIGIWSDSVAYGKENNLKIARTSIENQLATQEVELVKVDLETVIGSETPLANVPFNLVETKDGKETVIGEYKTNAEGKITVTVPVGSYKFVEVEPLENYLPSDQDYPFDVTVEHNGDKIFLKAINKLKDPTLGTKATGINGEKDFDPTVENTVVDDLNFYVPILNQEMTIVTELKEAATGKVVQSQKEKKTFTEANGTHRITMVIPANTLDPGKDYVFAEHVYRDPEETILYVEHDDLNDKGQTIHMLTPIEKVFFPQTGERVNPLFFLVGMGLIGLTAVYFYGRNKKEKNLTV